MKKISAFLAIAFFAGTVSVFAQTQPKETPKAAAKKECNLGNSCCADKSKAAKKTAPAPKTPIKKG